VVDHQDHAALAAQIRKGPQDQIAVFLVDAGGRFVQQDQAGETDQAGGQVGPLGHAAGTAAQRFVQEGGDIGHFRGRIDGCLQWLSVQAAQGSPEDKVLADREVGSQGDMLRNKADHGAVAAGLADRHTHQGDLSAVGRQDRRQDMDQRRLASPVAAADAQDGRGPHGKRDPAQDGLSFVTLVDVISDQHASVWPYSMFSPILDMISKSSFMASSLNRAARASSSETSTRSPSLYGGMSASAEPSFS